MTKNQALVRSQITQAQSLAKSGQYREALQLLEMVCRMHKRNADAWFMRGGILGNVGNLRDAIVCFRRAIQLRPRHVLSYFNLGNALSSQGLHDEAVDAFSQALKLDPQRPEILRAVARAEVNCGRLRVAIKYYRMYLKLKPDDPEICGNLGACLFYAGELEEASNCYQHALDRRLDAAWFDGLGAVLCQQGRHSEAISAHREAVKLQPENMRFHSNLLLSLQYKSNLTQKEVFDEHILWGQKYRLSPTQRGEFTNIPNVNRQIRIGYVSPDFRTHSVAYFFEPLLQHHSKTEFDVFCYACAHKQDETTGRLRNFAQHWREISDLSDDQAIKKIQSDGIDILVDLAGHTAGNRLGVFAGKPAPIQVTWLGYPGSTGLEVIDYRFTDEQADPPGNEVFYTERLMYMPECFLCYGPPGITPSVASAPVTRNGFVTFGSFNNLAKINDDVIALWSQLLSKVPDSRILIKNPSLTDKATADRYKTLFNRNGVSSHRIELLGLSPTTQDHLDAYRRIDIALDTYPYNGTTTTCEALYMGVPVVTLKGQSHAGRVGISILSAIGCDEFVAETAEEYILCAMALAENISMLVSLRSSLRKRMHDSSLCDGPAFASKVERAYHAMWQTWCALKTG